MNRLSGTITALETEGEISLVEMDVHGCRLTSLVLESERSADYLAPGKSINVLFKESEVSLALGACLDLSIRNRLPCSIRGITGGRILSHVDLEFGPYTLHSLITTQALRELGLKAGMPVYALIKSTEVSLAEGHAPV